MNYGKIFAVIVLVAAIIALLGCTGSQTTSNTPTASPAMASVGFARKNPAPINTPVTHDFEITEHDSTTGKFTYIKAQEKVTVLYIVRGYDNVEADLSGSGAVKLNNYKSNAEYYGFEPLLIKMKYELVSIDGDLSQPWQTTDYDVDLIATDGSTYTGSIGGQPFHIFTGDYGVPELWYESYEPGSVEGYVLMFVDNTDHDPLLRFDAGGSSDVDLWFKTTP
jgi:hypothetical protein